MSSPFTWDGARGRPIGWLQDPRARAHASDPLLRAATSTQGGALREIGPVTTSGKGEDGGLRGPLRVRVALDSGTVRDYEYPVGIGQWQPPGSLPPLCALGDAATGRLYPAYYLPADDGAALLGRRLSLSQYCRESEWGSPCTPYTILWLEEGTSARR